MLFAPVSILSIEEGCLVFMVIKRNNSNYTYINYNSGGRPIIILKEWNV
jgi:hypothetical protein